MRSGGVIATPFTGFGGRGSVTEGFLELLVGEPLGLGPGGMGKGVVVGRVGVRNLITVFRRGSVWD